MGQPDLCNYLAIVLTKYKINIIIYTDYGKMLSLEPAAWKSIRLEKLKEYLKKDLQKADST